MRLIVNTDGGARGNPGPAGIGVVVRQGEILKQVQDDNSVVQDDKNILYEFGEYIGETTNNQAEYRALTKALEIIKNEFESVEEVEFRLDSELVVKQLKGEYRMKNEGLKPLFEQVKQLVAEIGAKCSFVHVPREKNKKADALVNKALDEII